MGVIVSSVKRRLPKSVRSAIRAVQRKPVEKPAPRKKFVAIARDLHWQLDDPSRSFLASLDSLTRRRKHHSIALYTSMEDKVLADLLTVAYPTSQILLLPTRERISENPDPALPDQHFDQVHTELMIHGPFDLIIDATTGSQPLHLDFFRYFFLHTRPGGSYIARDYRSAEYSEEPNLWRQVAHLVDGPPTPQADDGRVGQDNLELSITILSLIAHPDLLLIRRNTDEPALPKTRDNSFNSVLATRPELGQVLATHPGGDFISRAVVTTNDHSHDERFNPVFHNPELSLRQYEQVVCAPHQIAVSDGFILPDTFRHYHRPRLASRFLEEVSPTFARTTFDPAEVVDLPGAYFYLDSEWPHHFGHTLTEQVSRLWAWDTAKRLHPDLKALIPLPKNRTELAPFQIALYTAAGIAAEDLITVTGSVRVETLLAATPTLSNPRFMHPLIGDLWAQMGRELLKAAPAGDYPDRVFVTRRPRYKRRCSNAGEVEETFRGHGFEIIHPEDYPLAHQVAMFDRARVVAGFAGSGMFNLAFSQGPKDAILVSSESYTARNEYMISSVVGHRLRVIWCAADLQQPEGGWSDAAFHSGYSFDTERDSRFLAEIVSRLPDVALPTSY